MQDDLAITISDAAIDRVAAHHRNRVGILLGFVFPDDLAIGVEVEGVDVVGEGRVDVHHVVDDQRSALVPAKHAGREAPRDPQVLDVVLVDLSELAVAPVCEVACRHYPFFGIGLHFQECIVRRRDGWQRHSDAECQGTRCQQFLPHFAVLPRLKGVTDDTRSPKPSCRSFRRRFFVQTFART
jgi:hypothetical protein